MPQRLFAAAAFAVRWASARPSTPWHAEARCREERNRVAQAIDARRPAAGRRQVGQQDVDVGLLVVLQRAVRQRA